MMVLCLPIAARDKGTQAHVIARLAGSPRRENASASTDPLRIDEYQRARGVSVTRPAGPPRTPPVVIASLAMTRRLALRSTTTVRAPSRDGAATNPGLAAIRGDASASRPSPRLRRHPSGRRRSRSVRRGRRSGPARRRSPPPGSADRGAPCASRISSSRSSDMTRGPSSIACRGYGAGHAAVAIWTCGSKFPRPAMRRSA